MLKQKISILIIIFTALTNCLSAQNGESITVRLQDNEEYALSPKNSAVLKKISKTFSDWVDAKSNVVMLPEIRKIDFIKIMRFISLLSRPDDLIKLTERESLDDLKHLYKIARFLDIQPLVKLFKQQKKQAEIRSYVIKPDMINIICKDGTIYKPLTNEEKEKLNTLIDKSKTLADLKAEGLINPQQIFIKGITKKQFEKIYALTDILKKSDAIVAQELSALFADREKYSGELSLALILKAADYLEMPLVIEAAAQKLALRLTTPDNLEQFAEGRRWEKFLGLYPQMAHKIVEYIYKERDYLLPLSILLGKFYLLRTFNTRYADPSFNPDGNQIIITKDDAKDNVAQIWDIQTKSLKHTLAGHTGFIYKAKWSPNGAHIITASSDNTAKVWDALTGKVAQTLTSNSRFRSISWHPDSIHLAIASRKNDAEIWNTQIGKLERTLGGYKTQARFSPNGQYIVTLSSDDTAKILSWPSGKIIQTFKHGGSVYKAIWSPDSKLIAISSDDETVKIWNIEDGKIVGTFNWRKDYQFAKIAWAPDSEKIAISSQRSFTIWNITNGKKLHTLDTGDDINSIAWNKDGIKIAVAGFYKPAFIYDARTGKIIQYFDENEEEGSPRGKAEWSTDGTKLALKLRDSVNIYTQKPLQLDQLILVLWMQHEMKAKRRVKLTPSLQSLFATLPEQIAATLKKEYKIEDN